MDPNANIANTPPPPVVPTGPSTGDKLKKTKRNFIIVTILLVIMVILAMFLTFRAFVSGAQLSDKYDEGTTAGKKQQAIADQNTLKDLAENPFRTYTAPESLGSFQISFPRNWSLSLSSNASGSDLDAQANPDYVDVNADKFALHIIDKSGNYESEKSKYSSLAKNSKGKLKVDEIKVSNITATRVTGALDNTLTNATLVFLPNRDKVLYLQTDDNDKYAQTFTEILAKAKINP